MCTKWCAGEPGTEGLGSQVLVAGSEWGFEEDSSQVNDIHLQCPGFWYPYNP